MPRTTDTAVALIIEVDPKISVTPFIEVANELVTEVCEPLEYTSGRLEQIERWLSAHFYAIRDMRASSESVAGISVSYQNRVDLYLANTMYGQQAMALDTKGGLATLNKNLAEGVKTPVKCGVTFVGGGCPTTPRSCPCP